MKKRNVGGQAVIEGVMMRGSKGVATAVRTPKGNIEVDVSNYVPYTKRVKVLGLPVVRGFVSLVESLVVGIKTLNYSASFFEEETEPSRFEEWFKGVFKEKSNDVVMGISLMISLVFAVLLFFILPTLSASIFKRLGFTTLWLNIAEGVIRVSIFLLYIYLIGKMEDINRVFQYHGAEHKTIFCYENEVELTPENAAGFTRLHPRCGTNFLFLVMMVSIILFSLTGWKSVWERMLYRVILLPIVSGITYELIRWLGKSQSAIARIIAYPGLKLQELTTREPDLSQIEVAIVALKAAEGLEYTDMLGNSAVEDGENIEAAADSSEYTIGTLLSKGYEILKSAGIESYILDSQLILAKVLNKDKLEIITNRESAVAPEISNEYERLIELRRNKMPVKYILGECEFMGLPLIVKEGVLIPRPDTEVLVEEVIKEIKSRGYKKVCDVCSGSGAIGLAIAHEVSEVSVDCCDIAKEAAEVSVANIGKLNLQDRVSFLHSDLLERPAAEGREYDVIVSNPPYIKTDIIPTLMEDVKNYEPYIALWGGDDGLDFYRRITAESQKCLRVGGLLAFEIGHDQKEDVIRILEENSFTDITCISDLAGNDRVIKGIKALYN